SLCGLFSEVRWIGYDHVKSIPPFEHLREYNFEVKRHLKPETFFRCRKAFGKFAVDNRLQCFFFVAVRFVKELRFESFKFHEPLRSEWKSNERIPGNHFVIKIRQRLDLFHILFVHDKREPKTKLRYFDRAGVNIYTVNAVLNGMAFELVGRAVAKIVEIWGERGAGADDLRHHAHRERA